jgi:hypothetical protein
VRHGTAASPTVSMAWRRVVPLSSCPLPYRLDSDLAASACPTEIPVAQPGTAGRSQPQLEGHGRLIAAVPAAPRCWRDRRGPGLPQPAEMGASSRGGATRRGYSVTGEAPSSYAVFCETASGFSAAAQPVCVAG